MSEPIGLTQPLHVREMSSRAAVECVLTEGDGVRVLVSGSPSHPGSRFCIEIEGRRFYVGFGELADKMLTAVQRAGRIPKPESASEAERLKQGREYRRRHNRVQTVRQQLRDAPTIDKLEEHKRKLDDLLETEEITQTQYGNGYELYCRRADELADRPGPLHPTTASVLAYTDGPCWRKDDDNRT